MSGLTINYIQYSFSKNEIELETLPVKSYPSKDSYVELRDANPDFNFYRQGDLIFFWPNKKDANHQLKTTKLKINQNDYPNVFSKIVELAIVTLFRELDQYKVKKNIYSQTWQLIAKKNILETKLEGISLHKRVYLCATYFRLSSQILFGITLSLNTKNHFIWKEKEFIEKGIDVYGLETVEGEIIPNSVAISRFLEATGQRDPFEKELNLINEHKKSYEAIKKLEGWLNIKKQTLCLPDDLTINDFKMQFLPCKEFQVKSVNSPKRFFFNGIQNSDPNLRYYNQQVKANKPYSYGAFEDKTLSVAVLFPSEYEGTTEVFISKLKKSLEEELHLKKIDFRLIKIPSSNYQSYADGLYNDESILKGGCDLFILVINEQHANLPPTKNPYLYCKAKLLGMGIPSQAIKYEKITGYIHPLMMSNICLNIYAKIGGTAWTIEKEEKLKEELIIGIGSTTSEDGKHILGIAQIFHSDGRYIVGDCAPLSTFDDYSKNLEEYLYSELKKVIDYQISGQERFRLIFHLYKLVGDNNEIAALERVMKRLNNYDFDYAWLHVGYGHNFRLYNDDGKEVLKKGTYVKLSNNTALLHFVPDSDLPLKIELDKRSRGFVDLYSLSKQVYWFSNLSHRSFNPAKRTVTIMYPSLMARMTEELSKIPNWDYDRLKNVSDKLWFL